MSDCITKEEIARIWLNQEAKCAIDWATLEQLCEVYRKHGSKELVFDAARSTYILRDKPAIAA